MHLRRLTVLPALLACVGALLASCQGDDEVLPPATELSVGTWGGEGAGLIVQSVSAHVHIGCTLGDFPVPVQLDDEGRFHVPGTYMLRAYPVAIGPPLPASFSGVVRGSQLTLGVTVNDTVQDKLVTLGPVTLELGKDPRMGPCPICRIVPGAIP
jgi:hypothetical protein